MVLMSMSSFLRPMSGAISHPLVLGKWVPHLGPSTSQDQTYVFAMGLHGLVVKSIDS